MPKRPIIASKLPHSIISEQYRKLRTNIGLSNFDKKIKVINITSAQKEEGKTLTSLNLSAVYAQTKQKTLLIDMDLRRPKIHKSFDMENKNGVSDFISSNKPIKDYIQNVNDYLDVIVSGTNVPFPTEIFVSEKMTNMISELKTLYDIIIIDCPPAAAVADSSIISNFCDGTVFVLASRKTNKDLARECIKNITNNGGNILGGVLTQIESRDQDYYYYKNQK